MRSVLVCLLTFLLIFSLVSCKNTVPGDEVYDSEVSDGAEVDTVEDDPASDDLSDGMGEPDTEPTAEEDDVSAEASHRISLSVRYETREKMWGEEVGVRVTCPEILLSEEDADRYPGLVAALNEVNVSEKTYADEALEDYYGYIVDAQGMPPVAYFSSPEYWNVRADDRVVSFVEHSSAYSGGMHPYSGYSAFSVDPKTGKYYTLDDVLTDTDSLPLLLSSLLREKYPQILFGDIAKHFTFYAEEYPYCFVLTNEGVDFYFSDYELASYADGNQLVSLTYAAYPSLFRDPSLWETEEYVTELFSYFEYDADVDGDGMTERLSVSCGDSEETGGKILSVGVDGSMASVDDWFDSCRWFYVHTAQGAYVYAETTDNAVGYHQLHVFSLNGGVSHSGFLIYASFCRIEHDRFNETRGCFTDPRHFILDCDTSLIDRFITEKPFALGEDGMPVPLADSFAAVEPYRELTVTQPLRVMLLYDHGSEAAGETELSAGTVVTLLYTDGESRIEARTDDDRLVRIDVENDGIDTVNGIPVTECFDGLSYVTPDISDVG